MFLIFLIGLLVIIILILFPFSSERVQIVLLPELSTFGYIEVEVNAEVVGNQGIVTLTSDCYQIIAYTEASQAESIKRGLAGKIPFRPNAHDLIKAIFESFDIEVIMVKITELKNNTFFGRIFLKQGNRVLSLDSRPSDGTAIAVRVGAPVYIKETLLKEVGRKIC